MQAILGKKFLLSLIVWILVALTPILPARACTLFAAAGSRVAGGGTLIAKNRDLRPQFDDVQMVTPPAGRRYLGLFFHDGARQGVTAGINDRGLVIVGALAGSVPKAQRHRGTRNLLRQVLTSFDSVAAVAAGRDLFASSHPVFYLLADRTHIALVEVAPLGRVALTVTANGTLAHTNHYLDNGLEDANYKVAASSRIRFHRIQELLGLGRRPLTLQDFITFSQDRHDGPDYSIWRTGSTPTKTRTLATWIVQHLKDEPPRLYVKLANPGEAEKSFTLKLDAAFWAQGTVTYE
jgi:hypothetical protein